MVYLIALMLTISAAGMLHAAYKRDWGYVAAFSIGLIYFLSRVVEIYAQTL